MDRILIVGQHTLIRAKLNSILRRSNIVEVFDTFSEAYSAVEKKAYDKVILDGLSDGLRIVRYQMKCSINVIYKLSERAVVNGDSISALREKQGKMLAERALEAGISRLDLVVPVPNTGIPYAKGFAKAGGYNYKEVLRKTANLRSFDIENEEIRKKLISQIIEADDKELKDKRICLIDEAVFTGTTLKVMCALLREKDVKEITVMIPTPPCRRACANCSIPLKPMILEKIPLEELPQMIGADRVIYQKKEVFEEAMEQTGMTCTDCFG